MHFPDPFHDLPGQPPANLPLADDESIFSPMVTLDGVALAAKLDLFLELDSDGLSPFDFPE